MVPNPPSPGNLPPPPSSPVDGRAGSADAQPLVANALAALLDRDDPWAPAGFVVVKRSTVRTILRGALAGIDVHVKLFRTGRLSERARDAATGTRARREHENLLRARALGLPAVEPLAHGALRGAAPDVDGGGGGDAHGHGAASFLVTRTAPGAEPFTFDAPASALRAVGTLLRTAHDLGFLPGDLHPGNLVLGADRQPVLLDLTSVRFRGEPDVVRRAQALAFFCQSLDGGPLDRRARPFLDGYLESGRPLPSQLDEQLRLAARAVRARALVQFGRRSTRQCRHTDVVERRRSEARWCYHRLVDDGERLRAACRAFAESPPEPTKSGRRGAVWLLDELVVKEREQGKAQKLWRAAYWLLFAGVPQAEPRALRTYHRRGHVFFRRIAANDLAAELAAGALSASTAAGLAELLRAARSLGDSFGRLHAHGLRCRDGKLENFVRDPRGGALRFVDLDGVRRKSTTDARGQGADLGRLLAAFRAAGAPGGDATLRAFLRSYCRARRDLLQPGPLRRVLRRAGRRAEEWASAHPGAIVTDGGT
jgi:tRNA A-37 threonylcarbamoyl transferase component Bud32